MINISPAEYFELDALIKLGCRVVKSGENFKITINDGDKIIETALGEDLSSVIKQTSSHALVRNKAKVNPPNKNIVSTPTTIYQ